MQAREQVISVQPAIPSDAAHRQARAGRPPAFRTAFTLLEILVVIVILSVLATAIVPRMLNVGQRQAELEAKAVQRLLSIAAEKSTVWNQPVAVDFQLDKSTLSIWTQREDARASADATGAARVRWEYDGLVEPVILDRLKISLATQDGQSLSSAKWRVTFTPGQPRALVAINLEPKVDRDGPRWTITLPVGETAASRTTSADPTHPAGTGLATQSRSIDLDDAGKGDVKW
jgi:prepilin-type N-terminal cleavage/methylation domain-containing protein